jgi:hypothetical protein
MAALNNTQLEILKLFQIERSEEELLEIKKLLSEFLFKKAIAMADEVHEEQGYTDKNVEEWTKEHFRISNSN